MLRKNVKAQKESTQVQVELLQVRCGSLGTGKIWLDLAYWFIFWPILQIIFYCKFLVFFNCEKTGVNPPKLPTIATIAYNMKGCLRLSTFISWKSPNLVKYTYGWSPLEQHHKIKKKKTLVKTWRCCKWARSLVKWSKSWRLLRFLTIEQPR